MCGNTSYTEGVWVNVWEYFLHSGNVYWTLDQHLADADVMYGNSVSYTCRKYASYVL